MIRSLLIILLLLNLLTACSDRPHSNPLDPENPATAGRPHSVSLISDQDTVFVSWRPAALSDLHHYNLYRRLENESHYSKIATLPPGQLEFVEVGATFDLTRHYRLSISTEFHESALSDSARIRPGPTRVWTIDADNAQLVKYSHDGEHEIFRLQVLLRPQYLAVDSRRRMALVLGLFSSQLARVFENGVISDFQLTSRGANAIAVDSGDHSYWIANADSGHVLHYSGSASELLRYTDLRRPIALAVDDMAHTVWVLDKGRGQVTEIDGSGRALTWSSGFATAYDLALHGASGTIWVADSNSVALFQRSGGRTGRVFGFDFASRVAVDPGTGECWVVDWGPVYGQAKVVKLRADGTRAFVLDGYVDPRRLAVNPYNGHCFVADALVPALVQIARSGEIVGRTRTLGGLSDVAIEFSAQ